MSSDGPSGISEKLCGDNVVTLPASSLTFSSLLDETSSAYRIMPLVTEPVGAVPLKIASVPTADAPAEVPLRRRLRLASNVSACVKVIALLLEL